MKPDHHIPMPHPVKGRQFVVGQTIRKYQSWFCHDDALAGWYKEGLIEKVEPFFGDLCRVWYRLDRLVMNGQECPQSWMIGRLCDFSSDSGFVQILDPHPQLVFTRSKFFYE